MCLPTLLLTPGQLITGSVTRVRSDAPQCRPRARAVSASPRPGTRDTTSTDIAGNAVTTEFEACLDFESDPALVHLTRSFVARALRQWDLDAMVDDVKLVVSELASNAVLHARTEILS